MRLLQIAKLRVKAAKLAELEAEQERGAAQGAAEVAESAEGARRYYSELQVGGTAAVQFWLYQFLLHQCI